MPNVPEYAVAFHGAASAGGRCTTVNPLYTANELAHQLEDSGARMLVTVPPFLEAAREAAERAGIGDEVYVLGEAEGATPFTDLLGDPAAAPGGRDRPRRRPRRAALLQRHHRPAEGRDAHPHEPGREHLPDPGRASRSREDDTLIGVLPFFHIYGMAVIMNQGLRAGATIVTMPRFDLDQFLGLIAEHGVTRAYVVPPIALALAKHPAVDGHDLSSVRTIMSGAAPLGAELAGPGRRADRLQGDPGLRADRDQPGHPRDPARRRQQAGLDRPAAGEHRVPARRSRDRRGRRRGRARRALGPRARR